MAARDLRDRIAWKTGAASLAAGIAGSKSRGLGVLRRGAPDRNARAPCSVPGLECGKVPTKLRRSQMQWWPY